MGPSGTSTRTAAIALIPVSMLPDLHLIWPIVFGLMAVFTARTVFTDREAERTHKPQSFRKTLPLTLVAALIEVALIVQRDLNIPSAIFFGLGVGWVTVLLLDLFGDRILDVVRAVIGGGKGGQEPFMTLPSTKASGELPDDMKDDLARIDQADRGPPEDKA